MADLERRGKSSSQEDRSYGYTSFNGVHAIPCAGHVIPTFRLLGDPDEEPIWNTGQILLALENRCANSRRFNAELVCANNSIEFNSSPSIDIWVPRYRRMDLLFLFRVRDDAAKCHLTLRVSARKARWSVISFDVRSGQVFSNQVPKIHVPSHQSGHNANYRALRSLLQDLFSAGEFSILIGGHYPELVSGLPSDSVSPERFFNECVLALNRAGRIGDSFFSLLTSERPNRAAEIIGVERMFSRVA